MPVAVSTRALTKRTVAPSEVRARASRMLEALRMPEAELSVLLCDDGTIHELNRTYRDADRPTDVLAFPMREGEGGALNPQLLGDVVISIDMARAQAAAHGRFIVAEVIYLFVYGFLHLLGFDHRTAEEDRRMRVRMDALCVAATIGR